MNELHLKRTLEHLFFATCLILSLMLFISCTEKKSSKPTITIYTSTYKEVIALYEPKLKEKFPDIHIEWFQAGSEKVASRLSAEFSGGGTPADIIMTSDLFFYQELKDANKLLAIKSALLDKWPARDLDNERKIVVTRYPVMVMAVNNKHLSKDKYPKNFKDLAHPQFKDKLTMPSPLESGTALTTIVFFFNQLGETFFTELRKNNILSAGGNGATLSRIKSGERPVGIVLLENILQDKELNKTDWIDFIIPEEGALPMPSPMAILSSTDQPEAAQKVLEWFLEAEAQNILIKGWVYSPLDEAATPNGAPEWATLKLQNWSFDLFKEWTAQRQLVKDNFQKIVLTN
jgi:iron(III) transport system substrate-binding protein